MAKITRAEIITKINNIDTALDALISAPDSAVSYKIGQISVDKSDKNKHLLELRKYYESLLLSIPVQRMDSVDNDFSDIGIDHSEYVGDS